MPAARTPRPRWHEERQSEWYRCRMNSGRWRPEPSRSVEKGLWRDRVGGRENRGPSWPSWGRDKGRGSVGEARHAEWLDTGVRKSVVVVRIQLFPPRGSTDDTATHREWPRSRMLRGDGGRAVNNIHVGTHVRPAGHPSIGVQQVGPWARSSEVD